MRTTLGKGTETQEDQALFYGQLEKPIDLKFGLVGHA